MIQERVLEDEQKSISVRVEEALEGIDVESARGVFNLIERNVDFSTINSILDLACGRGELPYLLAQEYPNINVFGVDISAEIIGYAQRNNVHTNLRYVVANAYSLPMNGGEYDLVICDESLHHFADPKSVVKEMIRVANNNGLVFIVDFTRDITEGYLKYLEYMERNDRSNNPLLLASIKASLSQDEYRGLAYDLGLSNPLFDFFIESGPRGIEVPGVRWIIPKKDIKRPA